MLSRVEQDALVFSVEPHESSLSSSLVEDADCWEEKFPSESAMTRSETWSGPQAFLCPITHEIMQEPVILVSDGITYEKSALTAWLDDGNRTSPFTGAELSSSEFRVNFALKNSIEETLKRAAKHRSHYQDRRTVSTGAGSSSSASPARYHHHSSQLDSKNGSSPESKSSDHSISASMEIGRRPGESCGLCLDSDAQNILRQCDLMFFQSVFIKEGFLTLEDFTRITLVDLLSMNVPRGYCRRLLSAINDYTMPPQRILIDDTNINKQMIKDDDRCDGDDGIKSAVFPKGNPAAGNAARRSQTGIRRVRSDSTSDEKVASDAGECDETGMDKVPSSDAAAVVVESIKQPKPAALTVSRKKSRKKIELFIGSSLVPPPALENDDDQSIGIKVSKEKLNVNLILLGDANTGKTTLRKRLALDDYVLSEPTTGVECSFIYGTYLDNTSGLSSLEKKATKYRIHATIWDPAGQERYAPITKSFFRKCHAAAVIFSPDDPHSWKSVEYWLRELDENAPDDIEVCLVCNKSDLILGPLTTEDVQKTTKDEEMMAKKKREEGESSEIVAGSSPSSSIALKAAAESSSMMSDQCCWALIDKATRIANERRIPFYCCSAKTGECVLEAFEGLLEHTLLNQVIMNHLTQGWVHVPSSVAREYHERGYGTGVKKDANLGVSSGKLAWKERISRLRQSSKLKRGGTSSSIHAGSDGGNHSSGLGWSEEGSILRLTGRSKSKESLGSPIVRCGCQ